MLQRKADSLFLLGLKSEMTPDVSYVKLLVDYITAQALIRYLLLCSRTAVVRGPTIA